MRKKGFTLVELMAVLIIVAVLALVLIPVVNGIVMSARKQTFKDTVSGLIDMAYNFQSEYTLNNEKNVSYPMIINCDGEVCKNSDGDTIDFKGLVPISGKFILESSSVVRAVAVSNGSLCAAGIKGEIVVSTNCIDVDLTGPVINDGKEAEINITATTNKITVSIPSDLMSDEETGVSGYTIALYLNGQKIGEEDYNNSAVVFTGLKNNTTYKVLITGTNGNKKTTTIERDVKTKDIVNPTIAYENTPKTAVNGYLQKQVAKVTFSNTNITNPTYYIKTTRTGTASANTVAACGTGDTPTGCSDNVVKELAANTWYKVSGDIDVTYNKQATSEAIIYAITYDSVNFSGATTKTLSKIDVTNPTVALGTASSTTNSFDIPYTLEDLHSGVASYTCKYSKTEGSYTTNGNSVTATKCSATGLTANTRYYYQVCVTDKVGNVGDCKTGFIDTKPMPVISCTYTNVPSTAVNDYLKSQVIKCTVDGTGVTSPQYFIKTTREGVASANTVGSCGTGTNPGSCNSTATKTLAANTWYKVSGNINVTYSVTATSTATFTGLVYDGNNYSSATTKTVSKIDADKPTVTLGTATSTTNSFDIPYTLSDTHSGVASYTCKYSKTEGSYTTNGNTVTDSKCSATGLTANTMYYYQVCVTDGVGNTGDCKTGSIKTQPMPTISCSYTNTPSTGAVNDYLKSQVVKCTVSGTGVTSPQYFIKTTREGTASANTVQACGTGDKPTGCQNNATKDLVANTWYKISGNINVTYNVTNTSTATLTALVYDGTNYSSATTKAISKIDAEKPTVTLGTATSTTNSITIPYTLADAKTGVASYTCKYSATSGSYTTNGNSVTTTSCSATGLTKNTTYYYQVCATDGVGNTSDCKTGSIKTKDMVTPTCAYVNEPSTGAVNDYYKSQVLKCTYDKTNVSNPQLYVRTTREGTSSVKTTHSCGTGTTPGSCTASAVTTLAANTWYKISGNSTNVTYDATATSTATLTLIASDGNNESGTGTNTVSKIDAEKPTVTLGTISKTSNSITIPYTLADAKTGIGSYTCKYSTTSGSYTTNANSVTSTGCTITGLTSGTTYYYQVCVTDGVGNAGDCKTGSGEPTSITPPSCEYVNDPSAPVNGYYKSQVLKCTYNSTGITNPQYFIRTTRAGTASANTTHSCGTGTTPGTCTTAATKSLAANTWYKVSGNINVTYNVTATSEATLIPAIYDGNNYRISTGYVVSKIDATAPGKATVTFNSGVSENRWQNNIDITLSATDNVEVAHYEYDWNGDGVADGTTAAHLVPQTGWNSTNNRFRAVDGVGNKGAWSDSVYIHQDKTSPGATTVTFKSGTNENKWQNNINIILSATDSVGEIMRYEVDTNGDGVSDGTPAADFTPSSGWNSSSNRFRAVDYAGNVGPWSSGVHIHQDTTKPTISSVSVSGKVATIAKADTGGSGLASYCVVTTNSSSGCTWTNNTAASVAWTASSANTYYAFVKDNAGNISASKSFTIAATAFCSFTSKDFAYTGNVQSWTVPEGCDGTYKLEVWGAQGNDSTSTDITQVLYAGGNGGYSYGNVYLTGGTTLYIGVGSSSGYNGGGSGTCLVAQWGDSTCGGSGGGATHIGKTNNLLKDTTKANLYIVAGGGGGAGGGNNNPVATVGNATTNLSSTYGQGQSAEKYTWDDNDHGRNSDGGGGGGFYGGLSGNSRGGGGEWAGYGGTGGSGYIDGVTGGSMQSGIQTGNGKAKITKQ